MNTTSNASDGWRVTSDDVISARALNSRHASPVTRHRKAFTIVELLVVIAIIGILAAILLPVLAIAKKAAQKAKARVEIQEFVTAITKYDSDYGRFPVTTQAGGNDITCGGTNYNDKGGVAWVMGITNNAELVAILMNLTNYPNGKPTPNMNYVKNPQRTIFLNVKFSDYNPADPQPQPPGGVDVVGDYRDPWGSPYIITLDLSYDEQCRDSNYCHRAVSQNPPSSSSQQGFYGLFNPDPNGATDNFLYHGKIMVWSAGPDRKWNTTQRADEGDNKDNILSWQ